jgi:hypothetical protein
MKIRNTVKKLGDIVYAVSPSVALSMVFNNAAIGAALGLAVYGVRRLAKDKTPKAPPKKNLPRPR